MITNILKLSFKITSFSFTACFLLFLLPGTGFAEDASQKELIKKNVAVSAVIKSTENMKNLKNLPESTSEISETDNKNHVGLLEPQAEGVREAEAIEETKETKEIKKTNFTKVGRRIAVFADPLPKTTIKTLKTTKTTGVKAGVIEKSFADNEQVNVVLSNRDINRVLVKADKIQSVNGPTGLYTAKNDVTGSVYIGLYGEVPFTVFASTVKGHNFSLLITPRAVTGRTVILESTSPPILPTRSEEADSHQKSLVTLINGMINSEALEDYAYNEIKKSKKTDLYGVVGTKPIASYSGSHLLGVISEIKNKSRKPLFLKPSYFYKPGVRAVALSQQTLGPSDAGLLYQIIGRE